MLFQEQIIEKVKINSIENKSIVASMMYGSFTNGEGDEYSDVEFYIFLEEDEVGNFDARAWVSEINPLEMMFKNEYGTDVVIFQNLIRGEFHFLPVSQMGIIKEFKYVGYFPDTEAMFIYDSTGKMKELLDYIAGTGPVRDTEENVNFLFNNFVNAWLLGVNVLKRGELARSLETLVNLQKYVAQLIRINENKTEHWLNNTKQLEKEVSAEAYEQYTSLTSALNKEKLAIAYKNALDIIEKYYDDYYNLYALEINKHLIDKLRLYNISE